MPNVGAPDRNGSAAGGSERLASGKLLLDEPVPGVARLTISNPKKRDALDHELLDALAAATDRHDARCLLIAGEGEIFSAGYDIGGFRDPERFAPRGRAARRSPLPRCHRGARALPLPWSRRSTAPPSAAALELAITADLRLAVRGAKLGMPPAKLGLIYSHAGLRRFVETCGPAATKELLYVGRSVDAERALAIGLVNQVVEPGSKRSERSRSPPRSPPTRLLSLSGNKRILGALCEHPGVTPGAPRAPSCRAARVVLWQRGLPRGRDRLRGEAGSGVEGKLTTRPRIASDRPPTVPVPSTATEAPCRRSSATTKRSLSARSRTTPRSRR